ncbi:hypothetical protein V8E55_003273 [Tylopilus felleus]
MHHGNTRRVSLLAAHFDQLRLSPKQEIMHPSPEDGFDQVPIQVPSGKKHLADSMVQCNLLHLKYNCLQVEQARQDVVDAEFHVRCVRLAIRKSGHYTTLAQCSDSQAEAPEEYDTESHSNPTSRTGSTDFPMDSDGGNLSIPTGWPKQ